MVGSNLIFNNRAYANTDGAFRVMSRVCIYHFIPILREHLFQRKQEYLDSGSALAMTLHLISRGPQCVSSMRRVTRLGEFIAFPASQQVRGKKKLAKIPTVHVQLLQNVPGYGRKGKILAYDENRS